MAQAEYCRFGGHDEQGHPNGVGLICTGAGNLTACQLCPKSETYWRNSPRPPIPADANPAGLPPIDEPDRWDGTLDWSKGGLTPAGAIYGQPRPCVMCGRGTNTLSPGKGVPTHKTCAEDFYRTHPRARRPPVAQNRKRKGEGDGLNPEERRMEVDLRTHDLNLLDMLITE